HSQAGWLGFILVALGAMAIAHRYFMIPARPARPAAARPGVASAPWLVPLLVLIGAVMGSRAGSVRFDWVYPFRVSAGGGGPLAVASRLRRLAMAVVVVPDRGRCPRLRTLDGTRAAAGPRRPRADGRVLGRGIVARGPDVVGIPGGRKCGGRPAGRRDCLSGLPHPTAHLSRLLRRAAGELHLVVVPGILRGVRVPSRPLAGRDARRDALCAGPLPPRALDRFSRRACSDE